MKIKFLIFVFLVFIGIGVVYFFIYTTKGTDIIVRNIAEDYVLQEGIRIEKESGNLLEGLTLENIELDNIENLPKGSKILVQKLFVKLTSLHFEGLIVKVDNARIVLPGLDPIIVAGALMKGALDLNIFSRGVGVNEVVSYIPDLKGSIPISGDIDEIDLFVTGDYLEPHIKGGFVVGKFIYKGFTLTDSPWALDFFLKDIKKDVKLYGAVDISKGDLFFNNTKINIKKGRVKFDGLWNKPDFNIIANAKIENTKIDISLNGSLDDPQLALSSDPYYSKEKLMIMLATGKSWKSVEDYMETGIVSADLTKDFIDYFFFAGKTNKFYEKLGICDVSVILDKDVKGMEAKKGISDRLEVGYGIEQRASNSQVPITTQKIQGEYKVTGDVFVGVEKEIVKANGVEDVNSTAAPVEDDKVYLKYKKKF